MLSAVCGCVWKIKRMSKTSQDGREGQAVFMGRPVEGRGKTPPSGLTRRDARPSRPFRVLPCTQPSHWPNNKAQPLNIGMTRHAMPQLQAAAGIGRTSLVRSNGTEASCRAFRRIASFSYDDRHNRHVHPQASASDWVLPAEVIRKMTCTGLMEQPTAHKVTLTRWHGTEVRSI